MRPVRIEMDTKPGVYLSPNEYTGLLVSSQLHRPLFRWNRARVEGDLLTSAERTDALEWRLRLADDASWWGGERVTADDVGAAMISAVRSHRLAWMSSVFARITVEGSSHLRLMMRQPVAQLAPILAHPAIAPRNHARPSGSFRVTGAAGHRLTLSPRPGTDHSPIELVSTKSREQGKALFERGELDIGWGVGVPEAFWSDDEEGPFLPPRVLNVVVLLCAGPGISAAHAQLILRQAMLPRGAVKGVLSCGSRFRDTQDEIPLADEAPSARYPLYYSDFPPNAAIADYLSRSAGGALAPTQVAYEKLVDAALPDNGFSLQLHTPSFPGRRGQLVEAAVIASGRLPADPETRELSHRFWCGDSDDAVLALETEAHIDTLLRRRVIGRMRSRFRSHHAFDLAPTGIFDFADARFTRQEPAHDRPHR